MKEFYSERPAMVNVYVHNGVSDIIMRDKISQEIVTAYAGEGSKEGAWTCDERQIRVHHVVSETDVSNNFLRYWSMADKNGDPLEPRVYNLEVDSAETREALKMILERTVV